MENVSVRHWKEYQRRILEAYENRPGNEFPRDTVNEIWVGQDDFAELVHQSILDTGKIVHAANFRSGPRLDFLDDSDHVDGFRVPKKE